MTAKQFAAYCRRIREADMIPALRSIAREVEQLEPHDEATPGLLRMIALKVVRIERTN